MLDLPVEIWRKIVEQYLRKPDWLALSQVSSCFRSISQESLYHGIYLLGSAHAWDDFPGNVRLDQVSRSLTARPQLGEFVRNLTLYTYDSEAYTGNYLDHPVLKHIALFRNLQKLKLITFHIYPDLYFTLCTLPHLRTVDYEACHFDCTLLDTPRTIVDQSSISEMVITHPRDGCDILKLVPTGLKTLRVDALAPMPLDHMFSAWTEREKPHALTTLELLSDIPSSIIQILESLPQLRRLSIPEDVPLSEFPDKSLPALPFLEFFRGPAEFIPLFVNGRPVHTVELTISWDTPAKIFRFLQSSSVPVTALVLHGSANMARKEALSVLMNVPLTLRRLRVGWPVQKNNFLEHWLPVLSRFTELEAVVCRRHITHGMTSGFLERSDMDIISDKCPSLRELEFGRPFPGVEKWRSCNKCGWEVTASRF